MKVTMCTCGKHQGAILSPICTCTLLVMIGNMNMAHFWFNTSLTSLLSSVRELLRFAHICMAQNRQVGCYLSQGFCCCGCGVHYSLHRHALLLAMSYWTRTRDKGSTAGGAVVFFSRLSKMTKSYHILRRMCYLFLLLTHTASKFTSFYPLG